MYCDSQGLAVTASSAQSVDLLDDAVMCYLGARKTTAAQVDALLARDGDLVLGLCVKGYLLMHSTRRESARQAERLAAKAEVLAGQNGASQRERMHIEALRAWTQGDLTKAVQLFEAVLADHPRDILALRIAQFITSYLGDSNGIRDSVARAFPYWEPNVPGYGFVLGCYAYGLEEAGDYAMAERAGRAAVGLNAGDVWAAHAVAHVMEMQGRPAEGISWINEWREHWRDCNNFARHLSWHRSLFHLARNDFREVLALYDHEVRCDSAEEYLDIVNAAGLLWRLEQAGIDPGSRWAELAKRAAARLDDHAFVFVDVHYMLALAATNRSAAESFLQACADFAATGRGTEAQVMQEVGLPLARAILWHRVKDFGKAVESLWPVRHRIRRIGGSHAQRDTFEQLLIDSCLRSDNKHLGQNLLDERMNRRPHDIWAANTLSGL